MQTTPPNNDNDFDPTFENEDFPREESFECWDGKERPFTITCRRFPDYGFEVLADEKGKNGQGYAFVAHNANSPYQALGALRLKMQRALSKRYITRRFDHYLPLHDTVEGRITCHANGAPAFVVDGIPLDYEDFLRILMLHEGWRFRLSFAELAEEF